jgi:hypothetical protein
MSPGVAAIGPLTRISPAVPAGGALEIVDAATAIRAPADAEAASTRTRIVFDLARVRLPRRIVTRNRTDPAVPGAEVWSEKRFP